MRTHLRWWVSAIFTFGILPTSAQFTLFPIPSSASDKGITGSARTQALTPMSLPFWDDFSFSNTKGFPHDTLWDYGRSVNLNFGEGINPPSIGVATFDGIDSVGNPYSVTDVLAKGIADKLISRPLRLDEVPVGERNSVYLSFFYQFKGNGEPPDPGDQLRVLFKNSGGIWITVLTIENDGTFDPNVFTQVLIPITEDQYFFEEFQFSIQNFGRLSGPYDTWNIDYVFLHKGRFATDTSYPDRTINLPLTSMLDQYYAIPFQHYLENFTANLTSPLLAMYNLEFIPGNTNDSDVQPINYDSEDSIFVYRGQTETIYTHTLDVATSIGNPLQPLEFRKTPIQTLPDLTAISPLDSAVRIKLKLWINSGDNVVPSVSDPLGDYDEIRYAPIDFRHNDTTQVEYVLDNYYAYDDGTAEFGAALNQPGAQVAYLFNMKTANSDTIVAIDFYFPKFGEDLTQSIEVLILRDLSGDPGSFLHRENIAVQRSAQNNFWRMIPNRFVGVKNQFYIGWKQTSSSVLAIGLDKNTNSGDKMFFNIDGTWEPNINVAGSLMIRPVFGKGDGIITGIEEKSENSIALFPNPCNGSFTVSTSDNEVFIYNLSGQQVDFYEEIAPEGKRIQLAHTVRGIYIVKLRSKSGVSTHRLMVE